MKHILFLFLITTMFISCKKDPAPVVEPSPFWGEAAATINGKAWAAWPTAWVNPIHKNNWHIASGSRFGNLKFDV